MEVLDEVSSDVDPEKDSSRYMAVLVESLSILGRVQDALDVSYGQKWMAFSNSGLFFWWVWSL